MLYLIGLGLNERGISKQGLLVLEKCKKVYFLISVHSMKAVNPVLRKSAALPMSVSQEQN